MRRISLLAFLSTGELGGVRCGLTQEDVENLLGPPEDTGGTSRKLESPLIWRYGDIELHFHERKVRLIFIERFSGSEDTPTGGSRIGLDPWVIKEGLSLRATRRELNSAGLEHTEEVRTLLDQIAIRFPSGVELVFSGMGEGAGLECISRVSETH